MCSAGWSASRPGHAPDLLPARRAGGDRGVGAAHGRREPVLGDPHATGRGWTVAEGAGHAAAPGPGGARGHPGRARGRRRPRRPPPRARVWQWSWATTSEGSSRSGGGPASATARSKPTAASATHRARGSPGSRLGMSSTSIDQHDGSSTTMRRPATAWGARRPSAARARARAGPTSPCDRSGRPQQPGSTTPVADAGGAQHAQGGVPDAGVDVTGEGVGHHDHVGIGIASLDARGGSAKEVRHA